MRRAHPDLKAAGAALYAIGSGRPEHGKDFVERTGFDGTVLCDSRLDTYRLALLKRGLFTVANPRTLAYGVRALAGGFRQGPPQGDAWQQGGVLVVSRAGEVLFHHAAAVAGEPVPLDAVLCAARAGAGKAG